MKTTGQSSLLTGIAEMFRSNRRSRNLKLNMTSGSFYQGKTSQPKKGHWNLSGRSHSIASLPSMTIVIPAENRDEDAKGNLMTMSFYQCPSTPSSSNSSSGYSGTPSTLSLCSNEMHNVGESCSTLVSAPLLWKTSRYSVSQHQEDKTTFGGNRNRDSGCESIDVESAKRPTTNESDCKIFLRKMSQKLDRDKAKVSRSNVGRQDRRNRNSMHVEDDNEAYLLGLLSAVGDVVVNRREIFCGRSNLSSF